MPTEPSDPGRGSPSSYPPGTIRIGSVGGVAVLVRSSWILVALLLAWLLAPQIDRVQPGLGPWKYVAGLAYAVLLYLTVLLHEMSHAMMAKRDGLPVRWITLSFLGGMTAIEGEPPTPGQEFRIAVVGPLTSIAVGVVAYLLRTVLPGGLIGMAVDGIAFSNLVLGALNLVPGLPLDGGRVLQAAVWKGTGDSARGTVVAAWAGRVVAVAVLVWPFAWTLVGDVHPDFVDYLLAWVVAAFLWGGATAALSGVQLRRRLPALQARGLARRVIAVPEDLSVAEAVRRAQEAGAGGIVVHAGDERLTGVVSEAALLATPPERRPWQPVSSVARTVEDGLVLPADLVGEELVRAMTRTPAAEYVLLEQDGSIYGLLSSADVDRAFAAGGNKG
ncbi:MAG: site-2 protease family protein [Marmoricola sp.]